MKRKLLTQFLIFYRDDLIIYNDKFIGFFSNWENYG